MTDRTETDLLGSMKIPGDTLWGVHTQRALENFPVSGLRQHPLFTISMAEVKLAALLVNRQLGMIPPDKAAAIENACHAIIAGKHHDQFPVDALQGGAGTSANMNMNEVLANLAIIDLGGKPGDYDLVHPFHHVNLHQSTNDVYPTAFRVTVLKMLQTLEQETATLQESFQQLEERFRDVVKLGRTQLQDAVPMTLGMEFGAYAEAIARDRWRIFKSRERIKVVNLGGTAIGTGIGAPREYIFRVVDTLRQVTGLAIARAENLVDATQNLDPFVEISGMLRALAVNLMKIASDLRLLSSGPDGGIGEIHLPPMQSGSSIMPGKVNPVITESVTQVGLKVIANDSLVTATASMGNLELNAFLPLMNLALTESLDMLSNTCRMLRTKCLNGIVADTVTCKNHVLSSRTLATILVPRFGYKKVEEIIMKAESGGQSIHQTTLDMGLLTEEEWNRYLSPKRMLKLGYTDEDN